MKNIFFKKFKRMNKGFTLLETLVAISIFTVSILGLLVILSGSITNTTYAKQKIIGTYLAQEGIEYIRNMRDTFVLYDPGGPSTGWSNFKIALASSSCQLANGCIYDNRNLDYGNISQWPALGALFACGTSNCSTFPLLYDGTTGQYGYVSGANSGFVRKIQITNMGGNSLTVSSTVFWKQGSGNYSITFSEDLYNWVE